MPAKRTTPATRAAMPPHVNRPNASAPTRARQESQKATATRPPEKPLTRPAAVRSNAAGVIRLQKILADAGVASRRAAERLILDGSVTVNGRVVTELGSKADPTADDVRVSGRKLEGPSAMVYLALNKPVGYVTTASDEYGRATVLDLLKDIPARVFPVGRLDRESEGLLLVTNDGDLTARLTHPRYAVEKQYHVLVKPAPEPDVLERLRRGVVVEGRRTALAGVEKLIPEGGGAWLRVTIHEGRNRQIRLMCRAVGLEVQRLIRMRMGPIELGTLTPGRFRALSSREAATLKAEVGLAVRPAPRLTRANRMPGMRRREKKS